MQDNNLIHYSKIFYRNFVKINFPMTEEDKIDFITFIKINRYLKTIRISELNQKELEFIINTLKEYRKRGIIIQIPGHNLKEKDVEYLKELNKDIKEKRLKCTLSYSEDYLKDNIFKQIIINTIKICGLLIFILVGSVMAYVGTRNYISMKKVDSIQENIENILNSIENQPPTNIPNENQEEDNNSNEQIIKNNYIASLFSINEDIVGWIKVNNTKVDYPVVKTTDNDFYLKNNLYKEQDINGWIYMDYRNNEKELQQNTIIYGHNMYYSGVMFGTLHKTANKSWYENKENLTISFNTMYETMDWEIFSIYKINKTSDYLVNEFASQEDFLEYIKKIKERSINDFQVEINPNDKILTLSTCTGENQRFVVHAKLKTEK